VFCGIGTGISFGLLVCNDSGIIHLIRFWVTQNNILGHLCTWISIHALFSPVQRAWKLGLLQRASPMQLSLMRDFTPLGPKFLRVNYGWKPAHRTLLDLTNSLQTCWWCAGLSPSLPIPYCQITLDNGDWSDLACCHPSSGQFLDTENQVQIRM